MPDDILDFLGLKDPHVDSHPHKEIAEFLGLKPEDTLKDVPADPYNLGPPEERAKTVNSPARTTLQSIHEAIDPSRVLPAWASRTGEAIGESAGAGTALMGQGVKDITEGRSATGVGNLALGAGATALSPVTGAVKSTIQDPLTAITGNPDFGDKAALMFPVNTGGPAARTALHNIHPATRAADFVAAKAGDAMPEVLARMRGNPRLRPIDTNDQLRMSGQGLVASAEDPAASRVLTQSMRDSAAGARDAVKGTYNEVMGTPPDAFEELQRLQNKAKAIGQAKIAPPLITAKPVDTSSTLAAIDKALNPTAVKMTPGTTITPTPLQQKLTELRQKLASSDTEVLTDADRLHAVQSKLRQDATDLMSSATGSDRTLGRELMDYRGKLVGNIDASAPGYKEGLKAYRDEKDIERAFQFGQNVLKNTQDAETAPGFLKQWMADPNRTPEELAAAKTGARQAVEQKMGSIKQSALDPARSGTDVPQIEFNRQKLEHLFGKEATDKMFKHLQDERDIALTNNRGLGNSKTAETEAARLELKPRDISAPHSNLPGWALAAGAGIGAVTNPTLGAIAGTGLLAARGAKSAVDWLGRRNDIARNTSIADILSRNDPETIARLVSAHHRVSQRNKLSNLLAPPP